MTKLEEALLKAIGQVRDRARERAGEQRQKKDALPRSGADYMHGLRDGKTRAYDEAANLLDAILDGADNNERRRG